MELYDSHIHSRHSHDSKSDIDEICKVAIEKNLKGIAITDHYQGVSAHEMDILENIRASIEDTKRAKEKFKGKLFVGIGVEMGDPSWNYEMAARLTKLADFDVIIGSIHRINFEEFKQSHVTTDFSSYSGTKLDRHMQKYFEDMLDMAKRADFDVLAHLTYPLRYINGKYNLNYDITKCNQIIDEILMTIMERNIALELNLSRIGTVWNEYIPNEDILRRYKKLGGNLVTIGSDAHKKVFKIMANKYRNRRKRHNLRANLICGIINFESRI